MRLPDKVKIGAHEYRIIADYKFRERADYSGQCDNSLTEIRIAYTDGCSNEVPDSLKAVTFIHELLHAIDNVFVDHGKTDERIIEGMSQGIAAVMVDNPGIFDGLLENNQ